MKIFGSNAQWLDESILPPLISAAEQLAVDEAMLNEAEKGLLQNSVVRTWQAATPVVVLGSSSELLREVNYDACKRLKIPILRRPSGGATVILGPGCVMWSIVIPLENVPPLETIHTSILDPLAATLSAEGPEVFREGTSDLVVRVASGMKKISGNALRVRRQSVLYHGTLLDEFPLELVGQLLRHPPREPEYRHQRIHNDFITNLSLGREQIDKAVRDAFCASSSTTTWPHAQAQHLLESRYKQTSWTERL